MDKIRDTALANELLTIPQEVDEAKCLAKEVTATSNLEERLANWGSD
jgi:hypothetical protein